MLKPINTYTEFDLNVVISAFETASGWEYLNGAWTGRYLSPVSFEIEYYENDTFQHEQDYLVLDNAEDDILPDGTKPGEVTLEYILTKVEKREYKEHDYIVLPFAWIVQHLRNINILPASGSLMFRN